MNDTFASNTSAAPQARALGGLLVRRSGWFLSNKAKFFLGAALVGCAAVMFFRVQSFLGVTDHTGATVLVVEGWMPTPGLRQAIIEFRAGKYHEVIAIGCLTHEDSGDRIGSTYADWGAQRLRSYGLTEIDVIAVPCYIEHRDRTYAAALTLKQWLDKNRPTVRTVDVATLGAHARRSRLLTQKALGSTIKVGIISMPNPEYDPQHWWRSSEGARDILGESIAYLYARFFFWPAASVR